MKSSKPTNYTQTTLSFENIPLKQTIHAIQSKHGTKPNTLRIFGKDLTNLIILTKKRFNDQTELIKSKNLLKDKQDLKQKIHHHIMKRNRALKSQKQVCSQKGIQSQISSFIQPSIKEPPKPFHLPQLAQAQRSRQLDETQPNDDPQNVLEYKWDILAYYKSLDLSYDIDTDYMSTQPEINSQMRSILINWLVEVHLKYKMRQETLYLTVNIIDQYLSKVVIERKDLQLVGITSLFIAGKYEEIYPPELKHYVIITDSAYEKKDTLTMERSILNAIQFDFSIPTSLRYLELILHFFPCSQAEEIMSQYILELCLLDYDMIKYSHGIMAVSVLCLSKKLLAVHYALDDEMMEMFNYSREIINKCIEEQYSIYLKDTEEYHQELLQGNNQNGIEIKAIHGKYKARLPCELIKVKLNPSFIHL